MNSDLTNGAFELVGALMLALNVRRLCRDKEVKGFAPGPLAFFCGWGMWNCYFYPAHGLWYSFAGGALLCAVNLVYVLQVVYYLKVHPWMTIMNFWENMKWPADQG